MWLFNYRDKYEEHYGRLVECGKKLSDPDPCLTVLQKLLEDLRDAEGDEGKRGSIFISLSEIFLKIKDVPEKWKKLVRSFCFQKFLLLLFYFVSLPSVRRVLTQVHQAQ